MKSKSWILYALPVCAFFLIRYFNQGFSTLLFENDLIGISIISSNIFELFKKTITQSTFLPLYYFLAHLVFLIFKNVLSIRIFNSLISLGCCFVVYKIGAKNYSKLLGIFLFLYLAINQFFVIKTTLIAPYCLNFLLFFAIVYYLFEFIKKPKNKNLKKLALFNILYLFSNAFAIFFVFFEFLILSLIYFKKYRNKAFFIRVIKKIAKLYLVIFPILLIELFSYKNVLISNFQNAIMLNCNSLYLLVNEYITPYLSFENGNYKYTTVGMLYSCFFNVDFKNINFLKLLITLFYSSILPLILMVFFVVKGYLKSVKNRILFIILITLFGFYLILFFFKIIDVNPIYCYESFFIFLILFGIELFKIKDKYIKILIIFCLFLIQIIVPDVNSFNIVLNKNYKINSAFERFIVDYGVNRDDLIVAPYMSKYLKEYYKKLLFFDFDYSSLKKNQKNGFLKEVVIKDYAKKINQKSLYFISQDYLKSSQNGEYFARSFLENYIKEDRTNDRIILFVDKLNSKPLSLSAVNKFANNFEYNLTLKKIDFRQIREIRQNASKMLYDSLKTRVLYDMLAFLNSDFQLVEIVEYKQIKDKVYKLPQYTNDIYNSINSPRSDIVVAIFKRRNILSY